jgi:putative peptide zinc metalloprotease protein
LRATVEGLLTSPREREEAQIERLLRGLPGVTSPNVVSVISPKGGVGKTTTTLLIGDLLASRLQLRVIAVDVNPDHGTLGLLAPDRLRATTTITDLLEAPERPPTASHLRGFVSSLPSGLHLLAAPDQPALMAELTPERYSELVAFLGCFYDVVLLDCGTGITGPLASWAIEASRQTVLVTTPEWITARVVVQALENLPRERTTVAINKTYPRSSADLWRIQQVFRDQRLHRSITLPHDDDLAARLDTGTYALSGLWPTTRLPVKQLGLAVAEQLG